MYIEGLGGECEICAESEKGFTSFADVMQKVLEISNVAPNLSISTIIS